MNKTEYNSKLKNLISDDSKFTKCSPDQSNKLKDRLNKMASNLKSHSTTWHHKLKRIGHYCNGHLYGLPKVLWGTEVRSPRV